MQTASTVRGRPEADAQPAGEIRCPASGSAYQTASVSGRMPIITNRHAGKRPECQRAVRLFHPEEFVNNFNELQK